MRQKPLRKRLMWQLGIKQMLDRARAIHYTTSEEQRLAEGSLGLSRGITIPLGVDEEIMQRCDRRDANVTPYVLVLSRLHPKKGLEDFIDVFLSATAPGDLRNWRLLLAGNGEPKYVAALERLVQAREATDRVIFTGWLDGEKRRTVLSEASLVALPSRQENFGLAVAEALACGVPVLVSTKVNLAEEIRAAGAGWVTSLDRFSQVATLIQALRAPAERSLRGAAGQKLVAEHFTWRAVGRQLVELYEGMTPRIDYPPATPRGARLPNGNGQRGSKLRL